jgi:hypothetical protein
MLVNITEKRPALLVKYPNVSPLRIFVFYRLAISGGGNRGIFGVLKKLACILRIY